MRYLINQKEIENTRKIESIVFNVPSINERTANYFFDKNFFKIKFSNLYIIHFNDIYSIEEEYYKLIKFIKVLNTDLFFVSGYSSYSMDNRFRILECDISTSFSNYKKLIYSEFIEGNQSENQSGIALLSDFTFLFGNTPDWGIVHDRWHDIVIIGVNDHTLEDLIEEIYKDDFISFSDLISMFEQTYLTTVKNDLKNKLKSYYY